MQTGNRYSQFELFPGDAKCSEATTQADSRLICLSLSLDKVLLMIVATLMLMVLSFSLGIERGKRAVPARMRSAEIDEKAVATSEAINIPVKETVEEGQPASVETFHNDPVIMKASIQPPENLKSVTESLGGMYTVQVASFKKEESAQGEAKRLKKRGYEIFVLWKGNHSVVCVGKFSNKEKAKVFSGKLKKEYKDCLVRRL
ncbi:MAG: SPOR domain-containing protein [Candidatus Omnitrophota bacterium]